MRDEKPDLMYLRQMAEKDLLTQLTDAFGADALSTKEGSDVYSQIYTLVEATRLYAARERKLESLRKDQGVADKYKVISAAAAVEYRPPKKYVVDDMYIAGYVTATTGAEGAFKTTTAIYELLMMAWGKDIAGYKVGSFTRGAIFAGENADDLIDCIAATAHYHNVPNEVLKLIDILPVAFVMNEESAREFIDVNRDKDYSFILTDTVQAYSSYEDNNLDHVVKKFKDAAYALADYYGAHSRLLAHPTKNSHNELYLNPKGAGVLQAGIDGLATVKAAATALTTRYYPNPKYRGTRFDELEYTIKLVDDCPRVMKETRDENDNLIRVHRIVPVVQEVRRVGRKKDTDPAAQWYGKLRDNQQRVVDHLFHQIGAAAGKAVDIAPVLDGIIAELQTKRAGNDLEPLTREEVKDTKKNLRNVMTVLSSPTGKGAAARPAILQYDKDAKTVQFLHRDDLNDAYKQFKKDPT